VLLSSRISYAVRGAPLSCMPLLHPQGGGGEAAYFSGPVRDSRWQAAGEALGLRWGLHQKPKAPLAQQQHGTGSVPWAFQCRNVKNPRHEEQAVATGSSAKPRQVGTALPSHFCHVDVVPGMGKKRSQLKS
jgi:hypothetical protein